MTSFQRTSIAGTLIVTILSICSFTALAQEKNSTFVHGFLDDRSALQKVADEMNADFQIDPRRIGYSSLNSIPNIASDNYGKIQNDAVVVAHSMGGLVSRSMVDQFGTSRVDALVTMGTPHTGVRGATTVPQGAAGALLKHWLNDLALGFVALGSSAAGSAVAGRVLDVVENLVNNFASRFDVRAVEDMRPTSSFLDNLNGNFSGTTPDATYAVAGLEDWNSHWRLAGSFLSDDDREGNAIYIAKGAKYAWLSASFYLGYLANRYFRLYQETGKWIYYDKYLYYANASQAFFVGFDSLHRQQQLEWAWNITGAWNGPGTPLQRSDGLVPYTSQVPSPLRGDQELRALSANHFELKVRDNAIDRVREAFRDVDVPKANQAPSASFTHSTVGLSASFSNGSSDADGTITSYQWSFGDGNTSTQANPSHYYSSDGTYLVTLTVTDDDGATASTTNYVSVGSSDCLLEPCQELK